MRTFTVAVSSIIVQRPLGCNDAKMFAIQMVAALPLFDR